MNRSKKLIGRRTLLKLFGVGGVCLAGTVTNGASCYAQPAQTSVKSRPKQTPESPNPDAALHRLLDGNRRFAQQQAQHPDQSRARLQEVAQDQHPFATLLCCSDSRVPPEILFDEGIGDLFNIRVAGNVVSPEVLGSLEYAVAVLGTPLIMVLGHERCGAVTAAVEAKQLPGHISSLVKAIKPALGKVKGTGDLIERAVIANVQYQIADLMQTELLAGQIREGKLKIVGGYYDLDTGEVSVIEPT